MYHHIAVDAVQQPLCGKRNLFVSY